MEDHNTPTRMGYGLDIDAESEPGKELLRDFVCILERFAAHDRSRRLVSNAEQKLATSFIRDGNAVPTELSCIELLFGFFEFKLLMLFWHGSPEVDLLRSGGHAFPYSSPS